MSVSSDFKKAVEYHNLHLKRAKEVREMHGEGNAYGNLGNAYDSLGDFKKAIEYHNLHLEIAKEVGDNHGEGCAYGNLGTAHGSQGDRISTVPTEEDYILTIGGVLNAQLQAKLVVLSYCHNGRGEIKAEGVVGNACAFIEAGARSVLVSLWAIDEMKATLELMKCFYQHLAEGKPASESLNVAMKCLRESVKFFPHQLLGAVFTDWR